MPQDYQARYRGVTGTARLLFTAAKRGLSRRGDRDENRSPPPPPSLGSGMAEQAGQAISGRQRQVDNAVEEAERGRSSGSSLSNARRPRY